MIEALAELNVVLSIDDVMAQMEEFPDDSFHSSQDYAPSDSSDNNGNGNDARDAEDSSDDPEDDETANDDASEEEEEEEQCARRVCSGDEGDDECSEFETAKTFMQTMTEILNEGLNTTRRRYGVTGPLLNLANFSSSSAADSDVEQATEDDAVQFVSERSRTVLDCRGDAGFDLHSDPDQAVSDEQPSQLLAETGKQAPLLPSLQINTHLPFATPKQPLISLASQPQAAGWTPPSFNAATRPTKRYHQLSHQRKEVHVDAVLHSIAYALTEFRMPDQTVRDWIQRLRLNPDWLPNNEHFKMNPRMLTDAQESMIMRYLKEHFIEKKKGES